MAARVKKPKQPSQEESWTALAASRGGTVETNKKGKLKAIRFQQDPFELVLDTYTQSNGQTSETLTRCRVLFHKRDDFRFLVYRSSIFSGIGKYFGMQDIEVGLPQLDKDFIVKADSAGRVQALLIRRGVSNALLTLRTGRFEIRKFKKRGVDTTEIRELRYSVSGVIREAQKLEAIVDLFAEATEHLVRSGSAWPQPSPIVL